MNSSIKYRILYYGAATVTALPLIIALLSILNWPVVAESALGIALFLHTLILAKTAKDVIRYILSKGTIHDLVYSLNHSLEISDQNRKF